jgi:hypothetical protein
LHALRVVVDLSDPAAARDEPALRIAGQFGAEKVGLLRELGK